jgi:NRAMP (natural resistance-associated macrophage protein)-like metal ion transporter
MGMVGSLVMPHNIHMHSALVQEPRIPMETTGEKSAAMVYHGIESAVSVSITVFINIALMAVFASGFYDQGIQEVGLFTAGRCFFIPPCQYDTRITRLNEL